MTRWLAVLLALTPTAALAAPLTADDCVAIALRRSPRLAEVDADIHGFRARLAEVESVYYPKLYALGWVAPMYTVHGSALEADVKRDYSASAWGPYTHLEATLAQPLYTFGRAAAGEEAASQRVAVERARRRVVAAEVALEVRRLYYTRLYALSMLPSLEAAERLVVEAKASAHEKYAAGTGEVTQPDLMRLVYGRVELTRFIRAARDGAELADAALKHAMGLPADAAIELAEDRLPDAGSDALPDLATLLRQAGERRPEWAQLACGAKAASALARAEQLANAPVLLLAGTLSASWTPTRDDAANPYHYDPYNELVGGVAVAVKWDFDPALAAARSDGAEALSERVVALRAFAESGIPLQVSKARQEVARHRDLEVLAREAVTATRRWMLFASTAYKTGTGEARDLVEGLVAYLQARRTHYEHLRDLFVARAELRYAVGDDGPPAAPPDLPAGSHAGAHPGAEEIVHD